MSYLVEAPEDKYKKISSQSLENVQIDNYYLGIDIGTTSVKVCLIDVDFNIIAQSSKETEANIESTIDGGSEQCVLKILETVEYCVGSIEKSLLQKVVHIGVCGQMHGVCLWKSAQDDLQRRNYKNWKISSLYTWMDQRCSKEFLESLPKPDSHLRLSTGHGCATLFWLQKNSPDVLREYEAAGTIMDFLVTILCNMLKPLMSKQNAASWGYFDTEANQWNNCILNSSDFPSHFLPNILNSPIVGKLNTSWLGIEAGTAIGPGMGDFQCSLISALKNPEEEAFVSLSTSAQIGYITNSTELEINSNKKIEYFPFFHGSYVAVGASLNGGNVLQHFVGTMQRMLNDLGFNLSNDALWTKILKAGNLVKDTDLTINPTLFGERHCPGINNCSVKNITQGNTDLGHIFRGLCKGIANNVASFISPESLANRDINSITGFGSALTRNTILYEELCKRFGIEISLNENASSAHGVAKYFCSCLEMKRSKQ